jgi:hypothetical protein
VGFLIVVEGFDGFTLAIPSSCGSAGRVQCQ